MINDFSQERGYLNWSSYGTSSIFEDSELSECQDTKTLDSVWLDKTWCTGGFHFPPTCFLLDLSTRVRVRVPQSTALVGRLEQSRSKAVFVSACVFALPDPIPHASPVPRPTVRGESRGQETTHSLVWPEPFALVPAFQRRFAPVAVCT